MEWVLWPVPWKPREVGYSPAVLFLAGVTVEPRSSFLSLGARSWRWALLTWEIRRGRQNETVLFTLIVQFHSCFFFWFHVLAEAPEVHCWPLPPVLSFMDSYLLVMLIFEDGWRLMSPMPLFWWHHSFVPRDLDDLSSLDSITLDHCIDDNMLTASSEQETAATH